jgi:hypothetical protein
MFAVWDEMTCSDIFRHPMFLSFWGCDMSSLRSFLVPERTNQSNFLVSMGQSFRVMANSHQMATWLVVLTILKNMSQWEGLSHI